MLRHWATQLGPCFRSEDRDAVVRKAFHTAEEHGFEEPPAGDELELLWREADGRWQKVRKYVRNTPGFLVTGPVEPPDPTSVIW